MDIKEVNLSFLLLGSLIHVHVRRWLFQPKKRCGRQVTLLVFFDVSSALKPGADPSGKGSTLA